VRGLSCALLRHRLEIVEIGDCSLSMRGRKDNPPFILENRKPGCDIARVIRSRFLRRHDIKIGAQENGAIP
jgi:hypothetical protein